MLLILEALASNGRPMTPSELGEEIDLPKPTLHRLCNTLEQDGFLIREHNSGRLRPARRTRVLAAGLQTVSYSHIARRLVLRSIANEIRETCNLVSPGSEGMVYLDRVDTPWPLRFQLPVGTEVPFHCTASGKLFLSSYSANELAALLPVLDLSREGPNAITDRDALSGEIAAIRAAGYSWDNEEFMAGMIAFAVPVRDPQNRFACALAFHAPVQRVGFEQGRKHVDLLKDGAKRIEAIMFAEDEC